MGRDRHAPGLALARLSYDQARDLLDAATAVDGPGTGWDLHELRHSVLTHLGEAGASLLELMAKSQSHDEILALCAKAGVVPRIGAEGRSVQTVLALVAAGFGGAVLSDSHRALRRVGVIARPLAGTRTTLRLVWRGGDRNPALERLRAVLAEVRLDGEQPPR
ncbi:LysR substrate-binding domain-containing protein [Nocardia sp. NPDC004340]